MSEKLSPEDLSELVKLENAKESLKLGLHYSCESVKLVIAALVEWDPDDAEAWVVVTKDVEQLQQMARDA